MNKFFKVLAITGMLLGSYGSCRADLYENVVLAVNKYKQKKAQGFVAQKNISPLDVKLKLTNFFNVNSTTEIELETHKKDLDYMYNFFDCVETMAKPENGKLAINLKPLEELIIKENSHLINSDSNVQSQQMLQSKVRMKIRNVIISPLAFGIASVGLLAVGGALGWTAHTLWS